MLSEQLAGWCDKYPDVQVDEQVFRGRAADCLLGYAGHAPLQLQPQLIVVGSRGRGGLTGLLLGSTSQAVIDQLTISPDGSAEFGAFGRRDATAGGALVVI